MLYSPVDFMYLEYIKLEIEIKTETSKMGQMNFMNGVTTMLVRMRKSRSYFGISPDGLPSAYSKIGRKTTNLPVYTM